MNKKYIYLLLMLIILIGSLKIPNILESTYPLDIESVPETFYNIKYLVQNLFYLVFIIFTCITLLLLYFKKDK